MKQKKVGNDMRDVSETVSTELEIAVAVPKVESRRFKMHPKLLHDVILRQAGTLSKAGLEAVMNSVDAGGSFCKVICDGKTLIVEDDGRGFRNRQEIYDWFEVFGQPHDESEGKIFGRFRMGRGQLFAYGKNTWTTQEFTMKVDFKKHGDAYDLTNGTRKVMGCQVLVELYDPLLPSELADFERDMKLWCRWMPIEVTLNGDTISKNPKDSDWTYDTDEAYISLNGRPTLEIYNLGAHVQAIPKYNCGTGGEIVSKQALQVNFARNAIQSTCPTFKKIMRLVNQQAKDRNTHKKSLDDAERYRLAQQARWNELSFEEWCNLRLFTVVTGRQVKVHDLPWTGRLTMTAKGDRLGDKVHRDNLAYVLAQETLDRFGFDTLDDLVNWLKGLYKGGKFTGLIAVPFSQISTGMDAHHEIIPENKRRLNEKVWLELIERVKYRLHLADEDEGHRYTPRQYFARKLFIGISNSADAWTDAEQFVAINRDFLEKQNFSIAGFCNVGLLVLHEFCHRDPDLENHDHDQGFYELFHDSADEFMAVFVDGCFRNLPEIMALHNKRLTGQVLRQQDLQVLGQRATEEMDRITGRLPAINSNS